MRSARAVRRGSWLTSKKGNTYFDDLNYRIAKVSEVMQTLIEENEEDTIFERRLKNQYFYIEEGIELLKKVGASNKSLGILICFNYFKSLILRINKLLKRKRQEDETIYKILDKLEKIHAKLDGLNPEWLCMLLSNYHSTNYTFIIKKDVATTCKLVK